VRHLQACCHSINLSMQSIQCSSVRHSKSAELPLIAPIQRSNLSHSAPHYLGLCAQLTHLCYHKTIVESRMFPSPCASRAHCPSNQSSLQGYHTCALPFHFSSDPTHFYIPMYHKLPFLVVMGYGLCVTLQKECDRVWTS
jgi:hypothetical protein